MQSTYAEREGPRNQDQDQEIGADQAQSAVELANNINSFCGQDERVKTVYKIIYDNLFSQACVTTLRNLNDFWVQQIALTLSSPPNNCSAGRPGSKRSHRTTFAQPEKNQRP